MRKISIKMPSVLALGVSLFLSLFISCKNEYITAPTPLQGTGLSRNAVPQNVSASNGREKIYLSWQEQTGAVRYYIYATDAATPREEDFIQITQTTETSIELDVNPGATVWYKISAVDSSFNETKKSLAVRGSTLARPEITSIENTEDKDSGEISVILDWFMSNCDSSTYRSFIEYDIKYTPEGGTENIQTYRASDLEVTHLVLRNLDPHTKYNFQIVARNISYGDTQESLLLNQETLHRLRPSAPEDLEATHGTEKNKVTLTFTLPEFADILKKSDGSYKQVPLKFRIFSKEHTSPDWPTTYTEFSPDTYKKGDSVSIPLSGQTNGVIYDYKVKSFANTDGITNLSDYTYIESSENSASVTSGWAMKDPALYVRDYLPISNEDSDNPSYISASLGFNFIWDNFHENSEELENIAKSNYKYWLYSQKKGFEASAYESPSFLGEFNSITALNQYTKSFTLPDDSGYYKFTVCIAGKDEPSPAVGSTGLPSYIHSATTANEQIVTDNMGEIENFTVTGGYKDKFIITWTSKSDETYTLTYTQSIDGVPEGITHSVSISSNGNVTDTSNVDEKGVERTYTLSARKTAGGSPISNTAEPAVSLGKPVPTFDADNPKYDSISVTWKKLVAASSYKVKFDSSAEVNITLPEDDEENANVSSHTNSLGQTFYTYTFGREELGDYCKNATVSGSDKTITVSATSAVNDTTSTPIAAHTLGPATVGLSSEVAKAEDYINSTWNSVHGANGYIIQRKRYKWENNEWKQDSSPESFYVDAGTLAIVSNGESVPETQMEISLSDGVFKLKDKYTSLPEGDTHQSSQETQSMIPWGIPIEYTVYPVLSSADKLNNKNELSSKTIKSNLPYANTDVISKKGSTYGYGLNVRASKAESSNLITVTWDLPYGNQSGKSSVNPVIYRRLKGRSTPFTHTPDDIAVSTITDSMVKTKEVSCLTENQLTKPYEFVVKYYSSNSNTLFVPEYIEDTKTKMDTVSNTEPANVGYAFYLPYFNAYNVMDGAQEGFSEAVNWQTWDYSTRKIGPADDGDKPAYDIWTKNKNNAAGWFQIASMDQNGNISVTNPSWYETTIDKIPNGVKLTPKNVSDSGGYNNGILKVQRDYKHYYMIRARRKNSEGKTIYTYIGLDENNWTYRRISPDEFAKCVLLIVGDALSQAGIAEGDRTCTGVTGQFLAHRDTMSTNFKYGTNGKDFKHRFYDLPGQTYETDSSGFASPFTIKIPNVEAYGIIMYAPYYFTPSTITVTHDSGLPSYQGTVKLEAGEKLGMWTTSSNKVYSVTADVNTNAGVSKKIQVSKNQANFEATFPVNLGDSYHDKVTHKSENENRAHFKNNWWLVRPDDKTDFVLEED